MNDNQTIDDSVIAAAVVAGDRERFAELVRRYHRPLLRVAVSRIGRQQWAEDLVQETFLAAYKSLHTYDPKYSFRTWLWTILLNQCRRAMTKHQRREAIAAQTATAESWEHELVDPQASSPDAQLHEDDRKQQLDRMLNALQEDQAAALRLRFFGELKFQEIADAMHCSLTTAKNRVRQGLQGLTDQINEPLAAGDAAECKQTTRPPAKSSPEELL